MCHSSLSLYLMVEHMMTILVLVISGGGGLQVFQEGSISRRHCWKLKIFTQFLGS